MENDSIRASGGSTLVDIWVEGKLRAICVTQAAIETFLGLKATAKMSEDERCEFVRVHLPQVVTAAKSALRASSPAADTITIEAGQLGGVGNRRNVERRKTERRKVTVQAEQLPHGERRRGDRRKSDRRQPPKPRSK